MQKTLVITDQDNQEKGIKNENFTPKCLVVLFLVPTISPALVSGALFYFPVREL